MLEICQHHDTQLSFKNKNKSEWNCNDFERRRKKKEDEKKTVIEEKIHYSLNEI